jgi:hypothetical protein
MKRSLLVLSLLLTTLLVQAQMSDIQVMQYVQRESKNGASQSQIATKLMQKGVTMQQLQRVRSQYEKMNGTSAVRSSGSTTDQLTADSRMRESNGAVRVDAQGNPLYTSSGGYNPVGESLETMSDLDTRPNVYIKDSVNLTVNDITMGGTTGSGQYRMGDTAVCTAIINGGFSVALIRKNNVTDDDYNTVFIVNLGASLFLYSVIFLLSSFIADFFHRQELIALTRISSLGRMMQTLLLTGQVVALRLQRRAGFIVRNPRQTLDVMWKLT